MTDTLIRIRNLHKRFGALHVLRGIDLDVRRGERIAIVGSSGSGKSTLLRCINFMEVPSEGTIELDDKVLGRASTGKDGAPSRMYAEAELCSVRERVGMVFQQFNLFPHMTVLENVMEGLLTVKKQARDAARARAVEQLAKVGLSDKIDVYPANTQVFVRGPGRQQFADTVVGNSSGWPSRARSRWTPRSFSSTSRRLRSTRSSSAKCCA